jgi:hypothetical protein
MADYSALSRTLVANAFKTQLPGLTKKVTVRYFVSKGDYDVESDSENVVYKDVPDIIVVAAKPTFEDVRDRNAVFSDTKLLIPGAFLERELESDTDSIIMPDGLEWNVRKCIGVPGESIYLVFVNR